MSANPPDDMRIDNELRELWQTQKVEERKMSLEQIRGKAQKFEKRIRLRNLIEYAAGAIVVVSFTRQIFDPTPPNFMTRVGAALIVAATIYVVFMLHRFGAAKNVPEGIAQTSFIEFHRASLVSQRDLLRKIWRWYLMPFVPGMVAMFASFGIRDGLWLSPVTAAHPIRDMVSLLLFAVILIGLFFGIAALNKRSARALQAEIDALEDR